MKVGHSDLYQGFVMGGSYELPATGPVYLLCGIPAERDSVMASKWQVAGSPYYGEHSDSPAAVIEWFGECRKAPADWAALAVVSVVSVMDLSSHGEPSLSIGGAVLRVWCLPLLSPAGRDDVAPGSYNLRSTVEGYIGRNAGLFLKEKKRGQEEGNPQAGAAAPVGEGPAGTDADATGMA